MMILVLRQIGDEKMTDLKPAERLVPALDMPFDQAADFIGKMLPLGVTIFKIGKIPIHSVGTPAAVKLVRDLGGQVFLDAKLHDTPDTVRGAAAAIVKHGVVAFNVHATEGVDSMKAAVKSSDGAEVLAVTVLTSHTAEQAELIYGISVRAKVLQFSRDAVSAGLDGVICSPLELDLFTTNSELGELTRWTPGIRPIWAPPGQQRRFTTPGDAIKAGATRIIMGGPLYNPPGGVGSSTDAANRVIAEIEAALS